MFTGPDKEADFGMDSLDVGTYALRAWVMRVGTSEPNAWKYSDPITVHFVKVASVSESATEVCVNEEVTFTANPSLALHCVKWYRQYRPDSNSNWGNWVWVNDGDTSVLNSDTPGEYIYHAFNGDSNTCATEANSIVTVVEVGDVNFSCTSVCVGGTCTASADIAPSGRDIEWTILEPDLGCDIDADTGVISAGSTPGTITVRAADANVSSCYKQASLYVVEVDLMAWGVPDADEEDPGLYINVNWDDDDNDGWDPNDTPPGGTYTGDWNDPNIPSGDNDLRTIFLTIEPSGVPGNVTLTFGSKVKLWETNSKVDANGVSSAVTSGTSFSTGDLLKGFLIEGYSGSSSFRDVELRAQYSGASCDDIVKITVFEVDLTGLFAYGNQQTDNDKKHSQGPAPGSSDKNGKISWDDADGDGVTDAGDPNCCYFRNCVEVQGSVKPAGVITEVGFDIKRKRWYRTWTRQFLGSWVPDTNDVPWENDDSGNDDEDLSPSASDHIYSIDSPGVGTKWRDSFDYAAVIADFREWVEVEINGAPYQCSDYYKWHTKLYTKPKDATYMTTDWPKGRSSGQGWISVPETP